MPRRDWVGRVIETSAGSTPAASLKRQACFFVQIDLVTYIRGVYPRGLIEANLTPRPFRCDAETSAGSTPAASLKPLAIFGYLLLGS